MQTQLEQLYNPLLQYVKNRINNKEDAEDLTQEVFFKLSRSNNTSVDNLKSWVYTIAKNTITDYYRKHRVLFDDVEETHPVHDEEDDGAAKELSSCIRTYINMLPEEYRSIMKLSELENVPQKDIATQLNMNYVTVRSKVQRGRKKLKEMFTECCTIIQGGKGSILDYRSRMNPDDKNCKTC